MLLIKKFGIAQVTFPRSAALEVAEGQGQIQQSEALAGITWDLLIANFINKLH